VNRSPIILRGATYYCSNSLCLQFNTSLVAGLACLPHSAGLGRICERGRHVRLTPRGRSWKRRGGALTASRRDRVVPLYTFLGRLKYVGHDRDREQPVYFTWQILDWNLPEQVREHMGCNTRQPTRVGPYDPPKALIVVHRPKGVNPRAGVATAAYAGMLNKDYAYCTYIKV
jgi:hypothetical protein